MAGREMLFDEGPTACPFVALESDRDRRSVEPDPRHRCYAEPSPAPRALAHQREFCLSPGFGGCAIFQDWAMRAAARPVPLRPAADLSAFRDEQPAAEQLAAFAPPPAAAQPPAPSSAAQPDVALAGDAESGSEELPEFELPPRRQPVGDAQATPPRPPDVERIPALPVDAGEPDEQKLGSGRPAAALPASSAGANGPTEPPGEPRRRRSEDWPPPAALPAATAPGPEPPVGAPLADAAAPVPVPAAERPGRVDYAQRVEPSERQQATPTRDEWASQRADLIPSWERSRYAAYPGFRRRIGVGDGGDLLRRLTRIFTFAALAALAVALLLLTPAFLAGFLAPAASPPIVASPSPTLGAPTPTPAPTPTVEPSPQTYTIQPGDTLFGIADQFGLTIDQIMAANPSITDPNLIQVGQVIVIPPDNFGLPTPAPVPTALPSATP